MIIRVRIREITIEVSLGSGSQSFKWLANVVSHRLKSQGLLRKSFEEEFRTVIQFTDAEGTILPPNESISSIVEDKDTVFAEVIDSLPSDEFGNPVLSEWMLSAYVKSGHGIRWYSEMEAYRESKVGLEEEEGQLSSLLFVGELSSREIDLAFGMDWQQMNWGWLGLSESDLEVRELKILLKNKYGLVYRLFSHYCGAGKVGEAYGMSLLEFGHLIHATGAINFKNHPRKIESIFVSITTNDVDDAESAKSSNLMNRVDLVYGLIKVALRNADDSIRNVTDLIKTYLSGPVEDAWTTYLSQFTVYTLSDRLMRKSIDDYYSPLKFLFTKYATTSKNGEGMTYAPFKQLFLKTSTIESNQEALVRGAFTSSMPSFVVHRSANPDFEELVFSEFIEAICNVAKSAISDSTISEAQKIRLLFHSLAELITPLH